MSVITFVNNIEKRTGKTLSAVAIATNMAISNNNRILLISTTNGYDKVESCYFEKTENKKSRLGIFGINQNAYEQNGLEGLLRIARSGKLTPELITNYTKVVFKGRLEVLSGKREKNENGEIEKLGKEYIDIINAANNYYDKVFIDLDSDIDKELKERIIDLSDLVIVNISQNFGSIERLGEAKKTDPLLQSPKTLILIDRYDKYSKYNIKNISRYLGEKNNVLTIPYNTLFFEASNEASVPDLFIKLRKLNDTEDRNAIFIEEVKRATENILYRLQELQARM